MIVSVYDSQQTESGMASGMALIDSASIDPQSVIFMVTKFLKHKKVSCDELSVSFVNEEDSSALHEKHFNDPTSTDCMTFPIDKSFLGELIICPAKAKKYVEKHGGSFYKELSLYVIHGLLHLLGFNDIEDSDRQTMRLEEEKAFSFLENTLITAKFS